MKMLVVSDSHGRTDDLIEIYEKYKNSIDMLIHLGDGCEDIYELGLPRELDTIVIRGNNDIYSSERDMVTKEINGVLIVAEHIPAYSYKYIETKNYKKVLYMHGHKHIVRLEQDGDVIILSPGALSRPRDNNNYAYAIVEITKAGEVSIEIIDIKNNILKKL